MDALYAEAIANGTMPAEGPRLVVDGEILQGPFCITSAEPRGGRVWKSQTTKGKKVILKLSPRRDLEWARIEASMMGVAAQIPDFKVPKVLGVYHVVLEPRERDAEVVVIVMEFVEGETLDDVRYYKRPCTQAQLDGLQADVKTQIDLMRSCTAPYIGTEGHRPGKITHSFKVSTGRFSLFAVSPKSMHAQVLNQKYRSLSTLHPPATVIQEPHRTV